MSRRTPTPSKQGTALIYAILLLFVLSVSSAALYKQLQGNFRAVRQEGYRVQACALAEAGLEDALARLRFGEGRPPQTWQGYLPGGHYRVEWQETPPGPDGEAAFQINAWGYCQSELICQKVRGLSARLLLDPEKHIRLWQCHEVQGRPKPKETR